MSTLAEAALGYARQGLRVHPCRPLDKRPLTKWGQTATTIEADVTAMWKRWPNALIAVCTGDGLVVVDVDPRHGGEFDATLAQTLTATTPGGGWHHYFSVPDWCRVSNAVGLLPGVDVRGEGGYVIAAPSPGYAWLPPTRKIGAPMLRLPALILDAMQRRMDAGRFGPGFSMAERVAEGGRNDYIARFVGYAIRMGFDDLPALLEIALEHNAAVCVPPLDDAEVTRTTRSILARHERA